MTCKNCLHTDELEERNRRLEEAFSKLIKAMTDFRARERGLVTELQDGKFAWAECVTAQRHLNDGSLEQAYWHYGYVMALRDVLRRLDSAKHPPQSGEKV